MILDQPILDRVFQPVTNFLARRGIELEACARQLGFAIAAAETAFAAEDVIVNPNPAWMIALNVFFGCTITAWFFFRLKNCRPRTLMNENVYHFMFVRPIFLVGLVASLPLAAHSLRDGLWALLELILWVSFSLASTNAVPPTRRRASALGAAPVLT